MRLSAFSAALFLVPVAALAQVAPPATGNTKAVLERLQANVAQITAPAEKQRWNANLAMWRVIAGKTGTLSESDRAALSSSLDTIRQNVAAVVRPAEKERWQANIRLWQMFIRGGDMMSPAASMPCCSQPGMAMPANRPGGVDAAFGRMTLNVARLPASPEKERWAANCDLWKAVLTSQP